MEEAIEAVARAEIKREAEQAAYNSLLERHKEERKAQEERLWLAADQAKQADEAWSKILNAIVEAEKAKVGVQ